MKLEEALRAGPIALISSNPPGRDYAAVCKNGLITFLTRYFTVGEIWTAWGPSHGIPERYFFSVTWTAADELPTSTGKDESERSR